jgi:hypothetical protein
MGPHFVQDNRQAGLRDLPGGLRARKASANDVDRLFHPSHMAQPAAVGKRQKSCTSRAEKPVWKGAERPQSSFSIGA